MDNNILNFLPTEYFARTHKKATAGEEEWGGPCPLCKEAKEDGFLIWPNRPNGGKFLCRKCQESGDGINFLMLMEKIGYLKAQEKIYGKNITRLKVNDSKINSFTTFREEKSVVKDCIPPTDTWIEAANEFAEKSWASLEKSDEGKEYLAARGLTLETAKACCIGWNDRDRYPLRTEWGLDNPNNARKIFLPKGLVLVSFRDNKVSSVIIRSADFKKEGSSEYLRKYHETTGGSKCCTPLYGNGDGKPIIVLESILDAALIYQEAGDFCSAYALSGNTKSVDVTVDAALKKATEIIYSPDNDKGGSAGWERWKKTYANAKRMPPIASYKDVGEMFVGEVGRNPDVLRKWAHMAITKTA